MIHRLGGFLSRISERWVPDPFVIAILLSFLTLGAAATLTDTAFLSSVDAWGGSFANGKVVGAGLWKFLAFGMMMCVVLVTGHALASAPLVRRGIRALAGRPQSASQAIALTSLVAMTCAFLHWGLGLIVGALFAREVALNAQRRGIRVHYPLLAAAGYGGLLVWHGGLSGTAPMMITQPTTAQKMLPEGIDLAAVPLTETLFSPMNLCVSLAVLVLAPLILARMSPADADVLEIDPSLFDDPVPHQASSNVPATPAERLNRTPVLGWLLSAIVFVYLGRYVEEVGIAGVDLNVINLLFLGLGLMVYGRPAAYARAIGEATSGCAGIILQFPIYAGIMAVMFESGLVTDLAEWVQSVASAESYGSFTFLSAGIVNLFVPSGGGQFGVQGPVVIQAASDLGVPYGKAVMAFAYGDQWTNMLQPFWALPLLGITRLKARQIIGYSASLMLLVAPIYLIALTVF